MAEKRDWIDVPGSRNQVYLEWLPAWGGWYVYWRRQASKKDLILFDRMEKAAGVARSEPDYPDRLKLASGVA